MNDINRSPPEVLITGPDVTPAWRRSLTTRRVLVVIAVLLAFALLAWLLTPKGGTKAPAGRFAGGGPMPVVTATVQSGDMPITLIGLGAVTPLATVTVQSQISGQIMHISFKEGQTVKASDPLILIDPRPYQVALEQAEGALARDKALLANARIDWIATRLSGHRIPSPSSSSPRRSRWSRRTKATSRPTRARSMQRSSTWCTATSSRRSAAASACRW